MPFVIVRNDITKMVVDAIVNAANTTLAMGGGVCGQIFKTAGIQELQAACGKLAPIHTGEAVMTPGFNLPAKSIIHTAGPVYDYQSPKESERLLYAAYTNALICAVENGCDSIAFPLISSGIYGYPKAEALRIAVSAICEFISKHDIAVTLVVFDSASFVASSSLLGEVAGYIDEYYVAEHSAPQYGLPSVEGKALYEKTAESTFFKSQKKAGRVADEIKTIDGLVGKLDESFAATLLRLIDKSGRSDAEVYKAANIDRRLFSKIRSNLNYAPSKPTALAFAIALELNLEQTEDLLERAGFALSHSRKFDVILEYFIVNKRYNIFEINEILFSYDQALLGG